MTIAQALAAGRARLLDADVPQGDYDAAQILAFVLGEDALRMRLDAQRPLPADAAARYDAMLTRRTAREPMQYILGEAGFMGHVFAVEPGVLIPRPDTEILCEAAIERLRDGGTALDIGTGSGALAIAMALAKPGAAVTAVDISPDALHIARMNAARLGAQVRMLQSDCFGALAGERFDVIVSNPPYITDAEMDALMPEVRFEPEMALRGGADGLRFYRRIAAEAPDHLRPGGFVLLEIGWQQREAVEALLRAHVGEPFALRDYGGNWRVVGARLRG